MKAGERKRSSLFSSKNTSGPLAFVAFAEESQFPRGVSVRAGQERNGKKKNWPIRGFPPIFEPWAQNRIMRTLGGTAVIKSSDGG
jgi:hypothetical protein